MRGVGALAVVAGCVVVLVAACGVPRVAGSSPHTAAASGKGGGADGGPSQTAGQPVPWVADVASAYVAPIPPPPPAPVARYAACTAAQLSGRFGSRSAGMGNMYNYFFLTNSSASPCTIEGGPSSAVALGVDGSQLTLSVATMNGGWGALVGPPVNLEPGQSAQAVTDSALGMADCTDISAYTVEALTIGVGDSGSVRVSLSGGQPLTLDYCGSSVPYLLGFGVQAPTDTPPPSPLDVLTVSRSMPATVAAGSTVDYTVTLTNPTAREIALSPCPSYAQFLVVAGGGKPVNLATATRYYYLNCQAAPEIQAHGSVTFAMQIPVPATAGTAKYGWRLQDTTLQTGGVTTVSGG